MDNQLLDRLTDADAQGERAVASLWPGDQFYFRKQFWTIHQMQWHPDKERLYVRTTTPEGEAYPLINQQGEQWGVHQPLVTFLLYGMLLFPAMLTDEHFEAEQAGKW